MKWDGDAIGPHAAWKGRASRRNVARLAKRRYRLFIYRAALARMHRSREAGSPPIRAAWWSANALAATFDLDAHDAGLLAGCLVAAVLDG